MSGNLGVEVSLILWLADHRTKRDILYLTFQFHHLDSRILLILCVWFHGATRSNRQVLPAQAVH
jgi:hypothetical protein